MRDYREKTVEGLAIDLKKEKPMAKVPIVVRLTQDGIGASLSFNLATVMMMVPMEPLRDIIRIAEKEEAKA